jgi:EmrB/QacA subfamily drug resistance transporter
MTSQPSASDSLPAAEPSRAAGSAHILHGAQRFEVLAAVMVVMFFSSMAQTVVSTALPNIISDLHGIDLYAWVFTAFILASAIVIPVYGKLSDVFGRKPLFVVAILLYILGNTVAGFAQTMEVLVAARAIAGLGAGGLQALSQITIGDIFTPQERGRWIGVIMSVFGLASIIGPTLGGWLTDSFSWRWVFWINIPFAVIPLVALLYALPTIRVPGKIKIDYPGIGLLILGLLPVLLAITWLGENMSWTSGRILAAFGVGIVGLALFVWQELRTDEPVVSPALFKSGIFIVCMLASFCIALGMYGSIMFVPLFVQGVVGTSAQDSGVVLTPMMIGFVIGSTVSGQLVSRWGRYRILALTGLTISCVGLFLFGLMTVHTTDVEIIRNMVLLGIGIGSTMPLFTIAVQNAFPHRVLGQVTATRQFFMSLGGAIGVPIMGALLNSGFTSNMRSQLSPALRTLLAKQGGSNLDPNTLISAEAQAAIHAKFAQLGPQGAVLYRQFIFAVRDGLALTMQPLFHLALGIMLCGLIVTVFLKEIPLRRHQIAAESVVADEEAAIVGAPEPVSLRAPADEPA